MSFLQRLVSSAHVVKPHTYRGLQELTRRLASGQSSSGGPSQWYQPMDRSKFPPPVGIMSFMRIPSLEGKPDAWKDLDACFVGVPLDTGTSNRTGTRFGPRQVRTESALLRPSNSATQIQPFKNLNVADVGDVPLNMYNLTKAVEDIRTHFEQIVDSGCKPLAIGGDHTLTYPVLQAIKKRWGPVGLIHVDAHNDCSDTMMGQKVAHGTTFRRAQEDGLLLKNKVVQIGIRGSRYTLEDNDWGISQGFRVVLVEECWHKSLAPLMEEVRGMMGDAPVYLSFDIDGIDPGFAPGTGTPEIGGLTPIQALEIIRGSRGLNLVGCDLVEVSPPYDQAGTTALLAANLLFEMLSALPQKSKWNQ